MASRSRCCSLAPVLRVPSCGSTMPSLFSWPKDCDVPPGPFGPEPSSGAPGSSLSPENEHQDLPWFWSSFLPLPVRVSPAA